jgi:hypothetical protein
VKISFEKLWAIFFSFHVDALLRRSPLNTSLHNQQVLLEKWEDPNYERQAHRSNKKVKDRIGEPTHKHLPQKKNSADIPVPAGLNYITVGWRKRCITEPEDF